MKINLRKLMSIVLIIFSLVLIFNKPIQNYIMTNKTNNYLVSNVSKKKIQKNKEKKAVYDFASVKAVATEEVFKSQLSTGDLPVVGGITIPDLEMNLPIFNGTTNENFLYGAGTMKAEQQMGTGNYALASHHVFNMDNADKLLFSPIVKAENGMEIFVSDKSKVYTYKVTDKFVVTPDRVDVINDVPNKKVLTLITCTDAEAQYRTVVRAELSNVTDYSKAPKKSLEGFKMGYNSMQK